ncbi:MAG TPA: MGMT family protein [Candidatus Limnocylindria bacterium]|nr:MGMT family protein [Candidatus Limnocylindria bacterium]
MIDASFEPPILWLVVPGPWGPIHLAASEIGLVGLELMTPTEAFVASLRRRVGSPVEAAMGSPVEAMASQARSQVRSPARDVLDRAAAALAAFLSGERAAFDEVPIDLRTGTAWDRRVLEAVRQVPFGETTSYGRLARRIGAPGAARAVGGAVSRNPIGLVIPCHRVIAGDGTLGGYGGDRWGSREQRLAIKRELLAREGVLLPT